MYFKMRKVIKFTIEYFITIELIIILLISIPSGFLLIFNLFLVLAVVSTNTFSILFYRQFHIQIDVKNAYEYKY